MSSSRRTALLLAGELSYTSKNNIDPYFFYMTTIIRMLIALSRGGADAVVRREFDLISLAFIGPENGTQISKYRSKSSIILTH